MLVSNYNEGVNKKKNTNQQRFSSFTNKLYFYFFYQHI